MRASIVIVTVMVAAFAAVARSAPAPDTAAKLLADARQALGGEPRLSAVHSFTAKGRIKRIHGTSEQYDSFDSFEIACELPDKFVQKTSVENEDSRARRLDLKQFEPRPSFMQTTRGFNGGIVIAAGGNLAFGLVDATQAFVELTLGLFAASFAGVPLQFLDWRGPEGPAVVVKGGVDALLTFDPARHLPATLSTRLPGVLGTRTVRYTDYRNVNGLKVPFRLLRGSSSGMEGMANRDSGGVEQWDLKAFHVNVTIDPKVFRPSGR